VAQQLEAKQQQRQLQQQQGQLGSERCLGQVYSLVHKLGCVARQAAAEGLLAGTSGAEDAFAGKAACRLVWMLTLYASFAMLQCMVTAVSHFLKHFCLGRRPVLPHLELPIR
jgi:hypothetical protein